MSLNEDEKPSETPSEAITAYCVKCNETTAVTDVEHWESNNKTGVRGRCSVCRGGMFKSVSYTHLTLPTTPYV